MKKILIVNNNLEIGGVQKALINLLREVSKDYDVTLLLFNISGTYVDEIPSNVKVVQLKSWYRFLGISQSQCKKKSDYLKRGFLAFLTKTFGRTFALKLISLTQRKIKEHYDVAISYLHNGNEKSFYGGCNEFVISRVNAEQKIAFLHCDFSKSGANTKRNINTYEKFDKIAACSYGCMRSFKNCVGFDNEKIFKVSNCHDFERILSLSRDNPVEYCKDTINIVSVARLSCEKGIDRALNAVSFVSKRGINVRYHIVGDGPMRRELEKQAEEIGISSQVQFYGNCSNPYRYMANADLLLIPSYHEAAPIVIDEARCLHIPILSTKTTSSDDMITDRDCGWVCENSQSGIDLMLASLLQDPESIKNKKKEMNCQIVNNSIAVSDFRTLIGG